MRSLVFGFRERNLGVLFFCMAFFSVASLFAQDTVKECADLWKFFEQSQTELAGLEKIFLQEDCQGNLDKESCKKMIPMIRELQGAITMLVSRIELQKCPKEQKNQTPCDRMMTMKTKVEAQIQEIETQQKAQNCEEKSQIRPCLALKKTYLQQKTIWGATVKKLEEMKCKSNEN
jgi:hypothetical protein